MSSNRSCGLAGNRVLRHAQRAAVQWPVARQVEGVDLDFSLLADVSKTDVAIRHHGFDFEMTAREHRNEQLPTPARPHPVPSTGALRSGNFRCSALIRSSRRPAALRSAFIRSPELHLARSSTIAAIRCVQARSEGVAGRLPTGVVAPESSVTWEGGFMALRKMLPNASFANSDAGLELFPERDCSRRQGLCGVIRITVTDLTSGRMSKNRGRT
jgi:hypothetical protein